MDIRKILPCSGSSTTTNKKRVHWELLQVLFYCMKR